MKSVMKFVLYYLVILAAATLLIFGYIKLDLLINPWIRHAMQEWKWYNYIFSSHGLSALYLKGSWLWLIAPLIVSILVPFDSRKHY